MDLITGSTGYIGGRLAKRVLDDGREVRALARDPGRVEPRPGLEAVKGDVISGAGLREALDGIETAYYLIHSMEQGENGADFSSRDRRGAENFARAAQEGGVERIVYLGGLVPPGAATSPHLRSRLEVEEILLEAVPGSTALRASVVIGTGSVMFRLLVRLVERLRVLPFPGWRDNRTRPIDERDAIEYLARTPYAHGAVARSLDIAGPDMLTYGEMVERIAELMGVSRMRVRFGASLTPPAAAVVAAVTGTPVELVRPLMESLEYDLLPRDDDAAAIYGIKPRRFNRGVEHALAEWERAEPLGAR
jgi:uncharacterized protein YbjT (DUF2867 family)